MCANIYAFISIYFYRCMCVHIHMYMCTCACVGERRYVCLWSLYARTCVLYLYIYIHRHTRISSYICSCIKPGCTLDRKSEILYTSNIMYNMYVCVQQPFFSLRPFQYTYAAWLLTEIQTQFRSRALQSGGGVQSSSRNSSNCYKTAKPHKCLEP